MAVAAASPPATPSSAPSTKPARLPTRVIQIEAGKVVTAVPRNIAAIGMVASSGRGAIWPPASPPTVITMTDTV